MYSGNSDLYEEANSALIGRVNYAYGSRYLLEAQFRYDGSSKFAKGHKWGFFPSISAGWRISEEPFFKSISALSFVNQLKVRASYGVLGDDLSNNWNYEWAQGYNYPATGENAEKGIIIITLRDLFLVINSFMPPHRNLFLMKVSHGTNQEHSTLV